MTTFTFPKDHRTAIAHFRQFPPGYVKQALDPTPPLVSVHGLVISPERDGLFYLSCMSDSLSTIFACQLYGFPRSATLCKRRV